VSVDRLGDSASTCSQQHGSFKGEGYIQNIVEINNGFGREIPKVIILCHAQFI